MKKKEIDECVSTARALNNLTSQDQVILVFDMLGDEQISALIAKAKKEKELKINDGV